jgi:hypothetical protein
MGGTAARVGRVTIESIKQNLLATAELVDKGEQEVQVAPVATFCLVSGICSSAQYIRLKSPESIGGELGVPGKGGAQGGVGPGGDGDVQDGGHGGQNPGVDRKNDDGLTGKVGLSGPKGMVKCLDCGQTSVSVSESTGYLIVSRQKTIQQKD